jgi:hypothetical protein
MSNADRVAALDGALDALLAIQAAQLAEWQAAGMPPTFSVDGESYSWGQWLASIDDSIERKIDQKQNIGGPFIIRSRGRA